MADSLKFYKIILENHIGYDVAIFNVSQIPGGCINHARQLSTSKGEFFVKFHPEGNIEFYEKEALGLRTLKQFNKISIPEVLGYGIALDIPYLILEFVSNGKKKEDYWQVFGTQLAHLHDLSNDYFGWEYDNYIGSLPQVNTPHRDWISFFMNERVGRQLQLARANNLLSSPLISKLEHLMLRLHDFFPTEPPALLHGDLWSGNVMTNRHGYAALIDPAVYYGHREAEIAFTSLFGGFDPLFYEAYFETKPVLPGFWQRADIYNIYPLLVHVNLFGKGYVSSVESILRKWV